MLHYVVHATDNELKISYINLYLCPGKLPTGSGDNIVHLSCDRQGYVMFLGGQELLHTNVYQHVC